MATCPPIARRILVPGFLVAVLLVGRTPAAERGGTVPDFSGLWERNSFTFEPPESGRGPVGTIVRPNIGRGGSQTIGDYTSPMLRPEAAALLQSRGETALRGEAFPTPADQCLPEPTPYILAIQFEMQILQENDQVTILYMADHWARHIRLNAQHPANVTASWSGDSVGHYEGDTLVIDTVGIKAGPLSMADWYGTPHSAALHVIERYRLIDGETARQAMEIHQRGLRIGAYGVRPDPDDKGPGLRVELTVDDPGVFTAPWSAQVTYRRALGGFAEVVCAESAYGTFPGRTNAIPVAQRPDF